MRVPLKLAAQLSSVDLLSIPAADMLERIGAQLGAVEEVIDWTYQFDGAVIARVVSCTKHENADKLNVCLIDDGNTTPQVTRNNDGLVQVVCGAPNVRAGLNVVWLPPGSTVPSTRNSDPFVLEARELRGVVSNGMLASAAELGISDDHAGILELPDSAPIGASFATTYDLDDIIIDCENKMFTHRPDCFGVLGVARELAGINGLTFSSPSWYALSAVTRNQNNTLPNGTLPLVSHNDIPAKVPRFMAQVVENVSVKPSTIEVQSALVRLGSRPINNLVDATNLHMHITAQPTHAFDYDKIKALCKGEVTIFPRMATEGETIELLNGKTVNLTTEDIVIATDTQAVALAGVMGGAATEVDATTKNIILECANFDMYTIRRTSMRHGIFSDAVTRFNKGQSHLQNPVVLKNLVDAICADTSGHTGTLYDSTPEEDRFGFEPISVTTEFINARLGSSLDAQSMSTLLSNVEFQVTVQDDTLVVTPPFWRTDIQLAEDVVEEVGRLHGFAELPVVLPRRSTAAVKQNQLLVLQQKLRTLLAQAGANEILSYSFVSGKLIEHVGQNSSEAYQLSNALSPELQYYRLTLTPSVLSKVNQNIRAGYDRFALYELGKTHLKLQGVNEEGLPEENNMLACVISANDKVVAKDEGVAYFQAKSYLQYIADHLGLDLDFAPFGTANYEITKPFQADRSALVMDKKSGNYIGVIGEYTAATRRNLKLPAHTAGFEILLAPLLELPKNFTYNPLAKFPGTTQDVTFKVDKSMAYSPLADQFVDTAQSTAAKHNYVVSIQPLSIFHKAKSPHSHVSFRIRMHHPDRSLTTEEATKYVDAIVQTVSKTCNVERI